MGTLYDENGNAVGHMDRDGKITQDVDGFSVQFKNGQVEVEGRGVGHVALDANDLDRRIKNGGGNGMSRSTLETIKEKWAEVTRALGGGRTHG